MSDVTCDVDGFSEAIQGILDRMDDAIEDGRPEVVREAAKTARSEWRANAKASFGGTGRYPASIQMKVFKDTASETKADIGSATMPGLPHLLEKGHAKVGGGRVAGREHIAPAAEVAMQQLEDEINDLVDRAIGGC